MIGLPSQISICFSEGTCNLKCPMCQTHGTRRKYHRGKPLMRGEMDLRKAARILDELRGSDVIIAPSGQTELFAQKDWMTYVRMVKDRGLKVNINTNGILMPGHMTSYVDVDGVFISVDALTRETFMKVRGVDKLDIVEGNIARLLEYRKHMKPRIGVSFVVQKDNAHEKDDFVKHWIKHADSVRVAQLHQRGSDIARVYKRRRPCPMLYRNMYIHYNGDVSVCCWDAYGHTNLGNVFKDGVEGVWNGSGFKMARHIHECGDTLAIPFCHACEDWPRYARASVRDVNGIRVCKTPLVTYYNRLDRLKSWKWGGGDIYAKI